VKILHAIMRGAAVSLGDCSPPEGFLRAIGAQAQQKGIRVGVVQPDLPKKWRDRAHGDAAMVTCADELEGHLKNAALCYVATGPARLRSQDPYRAQGERLH
jgi:hypothetical protein